MKVLGLTRNNKIVATTEDLDIDSLELFYKDFTVDDHFDAMCIWAAYPSLDYIHGFKNKEFHARKADITQDMLVNNAIAYIAIGKQFRFYLKRSDIVKGDDK